MKRRVGTYLILGLLLSLLILAGCKKNDKEPQLKTGFIGGKEGIVPALEVTSGKENEVLDAGLEDFQINVNLENKGEHTVKENEILATLIGIDYRSFSINPASLKNIEPVDKIRKEQEKKLSGGQTALSFPANFKDDIPVDQVYDLGVNVCSTYQTGATTNLCLRKEATRRGEQTAKCKIDNPKLLAGSSAAPVQITSLNQRPTGKNEISFIMTIENVGKGDVYPPSFIQQNAQCLEKTDTKNKLNVAVSFPDNRPSITCPALKNSNKGEVSLIQGKTTITCKIDTNQEQETTFTRSPTIELDYVYKNTISTKITVKNAA